MKIEVTHIEAPLTGFEAAHPFRVTLGPGAGGRYIQRSHLTLDELKELADQLEKVLDAAGYPHA